MVVKQVVALEVLQERLILAVVVALEMQPDLLEQLLVAVVQE